MNLEEMERKGMIYARSKDIPRVRSLLESSQTVADVTLTIPLKEDTATLIFREIYESIRQLGAALLWTLGYESETYEASLTILTQTGINFSKLDRFRKLRNDSNYRGYLIPLEQAKEIVNFWKHRNKDIISFIKKKID